MSRVVVLHEALPPGAPPEADDNRVQTEAVAAALGSHGHDVTTVAVDANLAELAARLRRLQADVVFNLVESLAGSDAAMVGVTALLDGLGIRYTGSSTSACALVNDKPAAKAMMRALALPTPHWLGHIGEISDDFAAGTYIVKASFEHASAGIDDDALMCWPDAATARGQWAAAHRRIGRPCFAEAFVGGREFNVALLSGPGGIDVLPPAEIDFSAFPAGKPRLVGYRAKWLPGSFEYANTPRRFAFDDSDAALLSSLRRLALRAFTAFGLRGYGRVDFRVDADGPWILELNANPCLAPDAGFAAAARQAGLSLPDAIERILHAALTVH